MLEDCGQTPSVDSQAPNTISRTHQSLKADRIPMNMCIFRVVRHGKHDISRVYLNVISYIYIYIYHHIICILIYIYIYVHNGLVMVKPQPVDTCSSYPPLLHLCMADLHILRLCSWSCGSSTNLESLRRCSCFPGSLDQLFEGIDHDGSQGIPKKVLLSGDGHVPKDAFRILAVDWGKLIPPHPLPLVSANNDNAVFARGSSHLLGLLELNIPVKTRDLWGNAAQIYEKCFLLNLCSTSHEMTPFLSPMFCLGEWLLGYSEIRFLRGRYFWTNDNWPKIPNRRWMDLADLIQSDWLPKPCDPEPLSAIAWA